MPRQCSVRSKTHRVHLREHLHLIADGRAIHPRQRPPKQRPAILDSFLLPPSDESNVTIGVRPFEKDRLTNRIKENSAFTLVLKDCERPQLFAFCGSRFTGVFGRLLVRDRARQTDARQCVIERVLPEYKLVVASPPDVPSKSHWNSCCVFAFDCTVPGTSEFPTATMLGVTPWGVCIAGPPGV